MHIKDAVVAVSILRSNMGVAYLFLFLLCYRKKLLEKTYSQRLSQPGSNGCGFFGLFGCVLKVVLPDVSPVSVAGIFRVGTLSMLCCCLLDS